MGGFVDPFIPSSAWPQDIVFAGSSLWAGTGASSLAGSSAQGMGFYHLQNGSSPAAFPAGGTTLSSAELHEQLQLLQSDGLNFDDAGALDSILGAAPCPVSLTDSAPVICSSNESSGSEQSGVGTCLPQFLMGAEHPAAWPPACLGSTAGPGDETSTQSFGFGGISGEDILHDAAPCARNGTNRYQQLGAVSPAQLQLQLNDDAEFSSGKLLSFSPGPQIRHGGIDTLQQMNQNEFSGGLRHLDLSSLVPGAQLAPFNPKQAAEDGKINGTGAASSGGGAAPKPRARARRGQATDPHSIAERLRREKISDRMKNLQELVPNSNKTDKASMLEEIIEYIKFLQLQTKVLSMSRLGATEAVVPLLMESQDESSGLLLGSPRSRSQSDEDNAAFEQEIAQLMENNMTLAMQYLQSKGLCLMPIGLASALSTQKGAASAAVRPETGPAAGIPTDIKFKKM